MLSKTETSVRVFTDISCFTGLFPMNGSVFSLDFSGDSRFLAIGGAARDVAVFSL